MGKELLGIYVSEHPLDEFKEAFNIIPHKNKDLFSFSDGKIVEIGGIISSIKKIITKTGEPMLFVAVEDLTGTIELLVFPSILKEDPTLWQDSNLIHLTGRLSFKDGKGNLAEPKVIVNKVKKLEKSPKLFDNSPKLKFENNSVNHSVLHLKIKKEGSRELLGQIKEILLASRGSSTIILHLPEGNGFKPVKITSKVEINDNLISKLKELLGEDSVKVREALAA